MDRKKIKFGNTYDLMSENFRDDSSRLVQQYQPHLHGQLSFNRSIFFSFDWRVIRTHEHVIKLK